MNDTDKIPEMDWPKYGRDHSRYAKASVYINELIEYIFSIKIDTWRNVKNGITIESHIGNGYYNFYDGIKLSFNNEHYKTIWRIIKFKKDKTVGEFRKRILAKFAEIEKLLKESLTVKARITEQTNSDITIYNEILTATGLRTDTISPITFSVKNGECEVKYRMSGLTKEEAFSLIKRLM